MKWLLAIVLLFPISGYSAGTKADPSVTPESRDEGDSPTFFNVACDPSVWTTVASSDTIRRVMFVQTDYQVQPPICLGTATSGTSTLTCATSSQALIIGTATLSSLSIYTKNAWTCRTAGAVSVQTGTLHGYIGRDKRDYGSIGNGALQ